MTESLDAALIAAHEAEDLALLTTLYQEAADAAERAGKTDAACFYLTHAYVFALQSGSDVARALNERLSELGREAPWPD